VRGNEAVNGLREITLDHLPRREILVIEGDGAHILIARRQVDTLIMAQVGDRVVLAQVVPSGKGIIDQSAVEVVEFTGPIHDRPKLCHGDTPSDFAASSRTRCISCKSFGGERPLKSHALHLMLDPHLDTGTAFKIDDPVHLPGIPVNAALHGLSCGTNLLPN
jgi:hypothetical protein